MAHTNMSPRLIVIIIKTTYKIITIHICIHILGGGTQGESVDFSRPFSVRPRRRLIKSRI